jgi:hypothetical protein
MIEQPSWRKPVGILGILTFALLWVILVATASAWIGQLYWPLQAIIYAVAGTIWIVPLGPVLKWIETGRFR